LVEGITIGIGRVRTVGGLDTKCEPPKTGLSNICASFCPYIAVVVGKSVVQAGEIVCNEALGTVGQCRVVYAHTIGCAHL
jgi:hypothetical protein